MINKTAVLTFRTAVLSILFHYLFRELLVDKLIALLNLGVVGHL